MSLRTCSSGRLRGIRGRAQPGDPAAPARQPAILSGAEVGAAGQSSRAWLSECLASANWLVKALDQRARTIVKVVSEIVKRQQGFFERGVSAMKPMTLREVAEAIGMRESTVSRVTSNKYLLCDRGLLRAQIFLRLGRAVGRGRRGRRRSGQGLDQAADRCRDRHLERRCDRRPAQGKRLRHRAPHRRQISQVDGHRLVDPAAAAGGRSSG